MARVLQLQRSLRSLSKPQAPIYIASLIPSLVGDHGRYNTRVSNILQDRATNKNSPYGIRTVWSGKDQFYKKLVSCEAQDLRPMTVEEANDLIREVDGWKLLNEGDKLKLSRSWRVKRLGRGLDLWEILSDIVDEEGRSSYLEFVYTGHPLFGWNTATIKIGSREVEGLTENDFFLASEINELDLRHLLSETALFLDMLKRKVATISA